MSANDDYAAAIAGLTTIAEIHAFNSYLVGYLLQGATYETRKSALAAAAADAGAL